MTVRANVSTYGAGSLPFVSYKDDDIDIDIVFLPISNPTFRGQPNNRPIGIAASVGFTGGPMNLSNLLLEGKPTGMGRWEGLISCVSTRSILEAQGMMM
jgi:hypothetical protein